MSYVDELNSLSEDTLVGISEKSSVGYSKFQVLESDIYNAIVTNAYMVDTDQSKVIYLDLDVDGATISRKFSIWNSSSGFYYDTTKSSFKSDLLKFNELCITALRYNFKHVLLQQTVAKQINKRVWNTATSTYEDSQITVNSIPALQNKPVKVGVLKQVQNKKRLEAGKWIDLPETKELNVINTFFESNSRYSCKECMEYMKFLSEYNYYNANKANNPNLVEPVNNVIADEHELWLEKFKGVVVDKRSIKETSTIAASATNPFAENSVQSNAPSAELQATATTTADENPLFNNGVSSEAEQPKFYTP